MSKKKAQVCEEKVESKTRVTTCTVDADLYQKFRMLCMVKTLKPKTQLESFIRDWVEQNAKEITPKQLQRFIGS